MEHGMVHSKLVKSCHQEKNVSLTKIGAPVTHVLRKVSDCN